MISVFLQVAALNFSSNFNVGTMALLFLLHKEIDILKSLSKRIRISFLLIALYALNHITILYSKEKGSVMSLRAAVIPAAGLGSRFLPFTKSVPKEMLPLINKPVIQHIIEEAIDANFPELFIVIGNGKQAIVDYFNPIHNQAAFLKEKDIKLLQDIQANLTAKATINYLLQPQPRGLGHAVFMAHHVIKPDSYFAVLLPDDILVGENPAIGMMAKIAQQENATVIAVQEVPQSIISSYGVIGILKELNPNVYEVSHLVEKPNIEDAPSTLTIVGRYILPQKIFAILESMQKNVTGELELTDAIQKLIENGEKVIAYKIPHQRFDTGTPRGWLEAIIHFGLNDPLYAPNIEKLLTLDHFKKI